MDMQRYLNRLSYRQRLDCGIDTIRDLALSHLKTVPNENLDNHFGKATVLDIDSIYRKIVLDHRGGGCYEVNSLLGTLLRRLGYQVDFLSGRVFSVKHPGREFDHLTLRVEVNGRYYMVDVGFGDGFYLPMELVDGNHSEYLDHAYTIRQRGERFRLESSSDGILDKGLDISLCPRKLSDFSKMNHYHSTDADAWRCRALIMSRVTKEGRLSLVGNKRTERKRDSTDRRILSDSEWLECAQTEFGLSFSSIPPVKARRLRMKIRRGFRITARRLRKVKSIVTHFGD